MDESDALVGRYLKARGFTDVRYEPDGNVPPDFLADGRVAVEVRRLNQNHDDGSGRGPRGLDEVAIPLWRCVREYLEALVRRRQTAPAGTSSTASGAPSPPGRSSGASSTQFSSRSWRLLIPSHST